MDRMSPPPLARILEMQMQDWRARQGAAEHALGLIQRALRQLQSRAQLSIDELCELLRSSDVNNLQALTRDMINQHITPQQEREWMTYWAHRSKKEVSQSQVNMDEARTTATAFRGCMERGIDPGAAEVQQLVERSRDVWRKNGTRERHLEQLEWNPEVTMAWFVMGRKLFARSVFPDDPAAAGKLDDYVRAARKASPSVRALEPVVEEAARLSVRKAPLKSAAALELAKEFARVTKAHELGPAEVMVRWVLAFGELEPPGRAGWEYLSRLVAR